MPSIAEKRRELVIGLVMAASVAIVNSGIIWMIATHGFRNFPDQLPPVGWALVLMFEAAPFYFAAETDYPGTIRRSHYLRGQARITFYSLFFDAFIFMRYLNWLGAAAFQVVSIALCTSSIVAIFYFARYALRDRPSQRRPLED